MNHWQPVAHMSELANIGDFVVVPWKAHGEIALTHLPNHMLHAFDNRCTHRGARIFDGLNGNREPRCGYHGRTVNPERSMFPLGKCGDWVIARPDADATIPAHIVDLLTGMPKLRLHSSLQLVMDCHWTVAIENALDFEHVAHVHAGSLATLGLQSEALHLLMGGSSIERFSVEKAAGMGRADRLFTGEPALFDYFHAHLFPYSCLSSTKGWTYSLQHYLPRADGRTNFIHRLYAAETTRPMPEFFDSIARLNEKVFREDAAICAGIPKDFRGQLGPREERIAHFRAAVAAADRPPVWELHPIPADSEGGEL